jgi:hypothetical protein
MNKHNRNQAMEHQAGKGHKVQAHQGQPLVVTGEQAEARGPGKVPLDDPATRQEHKATLDLGQLDDVETDTMGLGSVSWFLAGVALVDVGELDGVPGYFLDGRGQDVHVRSVLGIGRVTWRASR